MTLDDGSNHRAVFISLFLIFFSCYLCRAAHFSGKNAGHRLRGYFLTYPWECSILHKVTFSSSGRMAQMRLK
jgi:hypothetical protein